MSDAPTSDAPVILEQRYVHLTWEQVAPFVRFMRGRIAPELEPLAKTLDDAFTSTEGEQELWSAYQAAAQEEYADDELQIDAGAVVSDSDEGAWVHAWVWVGQESVPEAFRAEAHTDGE